jgi:hypothetical protein
MLYHPLELEHRRFMIGHARIVAQRDGCLHQMLDNRRPQ